MKEKKYLPLYYKWMDAKRMPEAGMCNCMDNKDQMFILFKPTSKERDRLDKSGFCPVFWASGLLANSDGEFTSFTPLRQTIVLFLAAMNNEL